MGSGLFSLLKTLFFVRGFRVLGFYACFKGNFGVLGEI